MNWGMEDFAAAAGLLLGAGIAVALVVRNIRNALPRGLLVGGMVLVTLAIWAHLAIGIF